MSEFLGSRISLISKSDIRYVGTLHEINSDESTVSLENVRSFGTEGRRGRPDEEITPSDQVYEYIVFRGSDVKDLRIEEHPSIKENKPPPAMPDDPAIVGARTQAPNQNAPPPPHGPPGAFPPGPYPPNNFYGGPPPPGSWGRGGGPGPMPGPGFGNMPYPPPPGWFPPGQGFPGGPGGPGGSGGPGGPAPWGNQQFPPGPGGPPPSEAANKQRTAASTGPSQESKPAPIGPGADRSKPATPADQPAPPTEPKSLAQVAARPPPNAPNPPVESKPSVEEVKAAATSLNTNGNSQGSHPEGHRAPTGPKGKVMPVVPLAGPGSKGPHASTVQEQAGQTNVKATVAAGPASVQDATNAARAAVAVAMSQLGNSGGNAMDNLTKKVNEMRVQAVRGGGQPGRGGRGRGGRGATKVEVPDSDFDFAQSNAKFNKHDILKEAVAGSSLPEEPETAPEAPEPIATSEDTPATYNKSRSFFDNISSEAKERAANNGQKPGGREWRGEEQRKNMETFGQGSVDGGYRNHRGRGRGRGFRGRGYGRGGRGGNHPQYQSAPAAQ